MANELLPPLFTVPGLQPRSNPTQQGQPPGRPEQQRERLAAPANPQAERHWPADAPGRLPVALPEIAMPPLPTLVDSAAAEPQIDEEMLEDAAALDENYRFYARFLRQLLSADNISASSNRIDLELESNSRTDISITTFRGDSVIRFDYTRIEAINIDIELSEDQMSVSIERSNFEQLSIVQRRAEPVKRTDPLALDIDGNGIQTTGVGNGVQFDIDGDGRLDQSSFVTGNDAMLALDHNGNGTIDSGRELFGDQNGHANGFMALADFDENGDGRIDQSDAVYGRLKLLRIDRNNRQSQQGLYESGIASISLNNHNVYQLLNRDDLIAQSGSYRRADGSQGLVVDLLLGHRDLSLYG